MKALAVSMKKILKRLLRNRVLNIGVRVPMRALLNRSNKGSIKYFLLRIPLVGRFPVRLPDGNKLTIVSLGYDVDPISRGLFWWGYKGHEPETAGVFSKLARISTTIFDVGANMGYFSLIASLANRNSTVIAFEPLPDMFECLCRNIRENHAVKVVTVPSAVTSYDGKAVLYVSDEGTTSSIVKDFRTAIAEIEVPAIALDSYVKQSAIDRVDLIKIDVETGERGVFEGMQDIVKRDEPNIVCEVLRATEGFLNDFLSDHGYHFYWITDAGLIRRDTIVHDDKHQYLNYLFSKEKLDGFC